MQRSSLCSFLARAKSTLDSAVRDSTPITFVLGNESADLDSLCSAVVFAYLGTNCGRLSARPSVHVPLSNLRRADLALRPELLPVLSRASIKPCDLITLSDLPPASQRTQVLRPEDTRWILIDHNAMQGELESDYGRRVIATIDHHDDEGVVPRGEPRIIRKSGSCASLVVDYFKESWDTQSHAGEVDVDGWDAEVALMALAPILIDTTNLTDATKVTPGDVDAVRYLESKTGLGIMKTADGHGYDRNAYFREISEAKGNVSGLSPGDILRKDYKQWTEKGSVCLGISSVVKGIGFLVEKAGGQARFLELLHRFADERQLSVIAVMTTPTSESGELKRELLMWGIDERGVDATRAFEQSSRGSLGLEEWDGGALDDVNRGKETGYRRCWDQKRTEYSRKQVAPLLRKAVV